MKFVPLTLVAAALAVMSPAHATAQDIGVVASLDPNLQGTPPGASGRRLTIGTDVVANEEIISSASGRGQLLFRDETTLSIAPSSRIVLDQFVYDPAKKDGSIGVRLTRGALRFIGGQTTKNREGIIQTPAATIGIRGSSAIVLHENGKTTAVFLAGDQMCMTTSSGRNCTTRTGGVLNEDGYVGRISRTSLSSLIERVDGLPPSQLARSTPLGNRGNSANAASASSNAPGNTGSSTSDATQDGEASDGEAIASVGLSSTIDASDGPVSTSGASVRNGLSGLFDDRVGSGDLAVAATDIGVRSRGNCGRGHGAGDVRRDGCPNGGNGNGNANGNGNGNGNGNANGNSNGNGNGNGNGNN